MPPEGEGQLYDRLLDACLTLEGDKLKQAIAREIDLVPVPISEPDEQTLKARDRVRREVALLKAQENLAHEFGANFDPGDDYRNLRRRVIEGELTPEQAIALLLAPYKPGEPPPN